MLKREKKPCIGGNIKRFLSWFNGRPSSGGSFGHSNIYIYIYISPLFGGKWDGLNFSSCTHLKLKGLERRKIEQWNPPSKIRRKKTLTQLGKVWAFLHKHKSQSPYKSRLPNKRNTNEPLITARRYLISFISSYVGLLFEPTFVRISSRNRRRTSGCSASM